MKNSKNTYYGKTLTLNTRRTIPVTTYHTQIPTSAASHFRAKEPGSALTHFIAMLMAIAAAPPLLIRAYALHEKIHMISFTVFILTMIMLYFASATYHTFDISEKGNRILKKMDHMMISVMIAGSYTPFCLIVIGGSKGWMLCSAVWGVALLGILIKAFWIYCPKWFSSVLYIAMGWMCLFALPDMMTNLSNPAFYWLLAGGIFYTAGGIIYSIKMPKFNAAHKNFGTHEIFHLFVMAGSICHYIVMFQYVAMMPLH